MAAIRDLDLLVCDGCGRSFTSIDGKAMVAALKGPCPDCGGVYRLKGTVQVEQTKPRTSVRQPFRNPTG